MATILNFTLSQANDGSYITITDTTGVYDVTTNPNGWGTPNTEISDIAVATLAIEKLETDGSWTLVYNNSVMPDLPNNTNGSLIISLQLEDGYYRCTYNCVNDGLGIALQTVKYYTFYHSVKCCFTKMAVKVQGCKCNCTKEKLEFLEAFVYLTSIENAAAETELSTQGGQEVIKAIKGLEKMCTKCGCGC